MSLGEDRQLAVTPDWYPEFLAAVTDRISAGRRRAVAAANSELVGTYWSIGREILARQDAEGWGTKVIAEVVVGFVMALLSFVDSTPRA